MWFVKRQRGNLDCKLESSGNTTMFQFAKIFKRFFNYTRNIFVYFQFFKTRKLMVVKQLTIAKPDSRADVLLDALSFALLS